MPPSDSGPVLPCCSPVPSTFIVSATSVLAMIGSTVAIGVAVGRISMAFSPG